jgi:hypothetical protein
MEILQGEKLDKVMDKFQPLCSPNIRNLIASFKHSASQLNLVGLDYLNKIRENLNNLSN